MKVFIKHITILYIGIFCTIFLYSQNNPVSLPKFNILGSSDLYLESEKLNEYDYQFKIIDKSQPGKDRTFVLMPLTEKAFKLSFKKNIISLLDSTDKKGLLKKDLDQEINSIFIFIQASGITAGKLSTEPLAGTIYLNQVIKIIETNSSGTEILEQKINQYNIEEIEKKDRHKYSCGGVKCKFKITKKDSSGVKVIKAFNKKQIAEKEREVLASIDISDSLQLLINNLTGVNDLHKFELQKTKKKLESAIETRDKFAPDKENLEKEINKADSISKSINSKLPEITRVSQKIGYNPQKYDQLIRFEKDKYDRTESTISAKTLQSEALPYLTKDTESKLEALKELESILVSINGNISKGISPFKGISKEKQSYLKWISERIVYVSIDLSETQEKITENIDRLNTLLPYSKSKLNDNLRQYEKLDSLLKNYLVSENDFETTNTQIGFYRERTFKYNLSLTEIDSLNNAVKALESLIKQNQQNISKHHKIMPVKPMVVEEVNIEFNQGYIENIIVFGKLKNNPEEKIKLANYIPIGFSREKDFRKLETFDLWNESDGSTNQYRLELDDLISDYVQNLMLNRRDYSPKDEAIVIKMSGNTSRKLYKDKSYHLFEAKVFSDFVGFSETEPNGLIQTEVAKKINLITNRIGFRYRSLGGILNIRKERLTERDYFNFGFLGYVTPSIVISKIENKNRNLVIESRDRFINNQYFQQRFSTTLDLRNYENLSVGLDLNFFTLDLPNFKSTLLADFGFRYGRTQVTDSTRAIIDGAPENTGDGRNFGINTFRLYPKFIWQIKPEERYGVQLEYMWNWYYSFTPEISQVATSSQFLKDGSNNKPNRFNTLVLEAFFNPSVDNPTGKLFFRYSFNHLPLGWNTNFHQAQLGYSFFLMGRNKER